MQRLRRQWKAAIAFYAATVTLFTAGCGGGISDAPKTASVDGVVTVKGATKEGLTVTFYPEGGGRPATGITDADGKFSLSTNNTGDGAAIGSHKAAVSAGTSAADTTSPPMPGFPGYKEWVQAQKEKIDPKYGDPAKSGLLYTVPEAGLPNLEIKIP